VAIGRQPRLATLAVFLFFVAAACSPAPSPSGSPSAVPSQSVAVSPLPVGELSDPPPAAVQTWLAQVITVGFRPLTASELALVRVTATTAKRVALAQPGQGYGPDGGKIIWTKVGCIFLGYYEGPQEPTYSYVPPQFPAYLVQLIGAPAPGFPGLNIGLDVLNAETGESDGMFGYGDGPVLGTTCGVSP
jgi:hypothetical protein